jgi:acyl carrier protein
MDDVKRLIRDFILATYLPGESADNLRDDTPLLSSGILDSLAALNLATHLEQQFGIQISAYDLGVEHFDRIDDIAEVVARYRAAQQATEPGT